MTGQLFLSHATVDKPKAQALRRALEDSGVAVWEDVLRLRAGDGLSDLEREVKGARGLLLLWTPAANESAWVEREAAWARQAREESPEYRLLVVLRGGGRISARRLLGEELVFIPADAAVEDAECRVGGLLRRSVVYVGSEDRIGTPEISLSSLARAAVWVAWSNIFTRLSTSSLVRSCSGRVLRCLGSSVRPAPRPQATRAALSRSTATRAR